MAEIQKLTTCLWFEKNGEEAARYYCSIFKNSSIGDISYYGKAGYEAHRMPEGTVMTVEFTLEGQPFMALNGGPAFKFNEAVSLVVNCRDQAEVDYYWEKLGEGGDPKARQCGWIKDKYGLSWQVTPTILDRYIKDKDKEKAGRVMEAMIKMKKIDVAEIEAAYAGRQVAGGAAH
jgi:predicted 3-demethylubiquinone-9 3-methyltransferase (glyoxalase superfamily)